MHNLAKIAVYHRAMAWSVAVHVAVRQGNWRGVASLKRQLLDAAQSVPANIAEGAGQSTDPQFANFLTYSIGSANESETHLNLAHGMQLLSAVQWRAFVAELDEIRRMLFAFRRRILGADGDPV